VLAAKYISKLFAGYNEITHKHKSWIK